MAKPQQTTKEEEPQGLKVETLDLGTEDDGTTPPPSQPEQNGVRAGERLYTEAEVREQQERARQQEKDKLYSKLEENDQALKELRDDLAARRKREADEEKARQEAAAAKDREELSAKELLERQNQEWEQRFEQMQREREADRALLAREAQFQELANLRTRLLKESDSDNTIAPELLDYVGGVSEDEIRQSIAMAQAKSASIVEQVRSYQQQQRRDMKGASVTQPPVGPMETDQAYETITKETVDNMSMADYAKNRQKLLAAASRSRFGAQQ